MTEPRRPLARLTALLGVPALLATALAGGIVLAPPTTPAASAAVGECPEGTFPGVGPQPGPSFTDNNIAIYAAGDLEIRGAAAEMEGLVVVEGDASFNKANGGTFNVGTAGVGSGIVPTPGTTMLAVGGNVTVVPPTRLDVGANAFLDGALLGGNADIGGTATPTPPTPYIALNNGTITTGMGAAATAPHAGFDDVVRDASSQFAAEASTGTLTVSGTQMYVNGTNAPGELEVFTVSTAQLGAVRDIYFTNIADDSPVVINITGAGAVNFQPTSIWNDGARADAFTSPDFGIVSARTLWNFVSSIDVTMGGTSQILGSIIVPTAGATITVNAHGNGRLYSGGDIIMQGTGSEIHNFPWIGPAPFDCIPIPPEPTGSITLQKLLADGTEEFLPTDPTGLPEFRGTVECALPDGGTLVRQWMLRPPDTVTIGGLPIGVQCTITEDLTRVTRTVGAVPQVPLAAFAWTPPVWTVNGETATPPIVVTVPAPDAQTQVAVTVTNALLMGQFTIAKVVENPDEIAFTDGFTGTWTCTHADVPADAPGMSGAWSLDSGDTSAPISVPIGSQCVVQEDAPTVPDGGAWITSIDPATFTVDSATTTVGVTVTNRLVEAVGAFAITKTFDPGQSGFTGTFTVAYDCGDGLAGAVALAAGETSDPIAAPIGAVCTVSEPQLPAPPYGWEFGDPVVTGSPVTITEGSAQQPVEVTVTNSISQLIGAFTIVKHMTIGETRFAGVFTIAYDCGGGIAGSVTLAPGIVSDPIAAPVGSTCVVTEPTLPDPPAGWEFGDPVISGSPVVITEESAQAPVTVAVVNVLHRLHGSFTITKVFEPGDSGFDGEFTIAYDCGIVAFGTVALAAGATSDPIIVPVGTACTVAEPELPAAPPGWQFGEPVVTPASFTVEDDETVVEVSLTNTIAAIDPGAGAFSIRKVVVNPDDLEIDDAFTGTWACVLGEQTLGGDWALSSTDAPLVVGGIPLGAECTVAEDTPTAPAGGSWEAPVISPASFTVTDAETTVAVTVTNTARAALPATGGSVPWAALLLGGGLLAVGVAVVTLRRRTAGRPPTDR